MIQGLLLIIPAVGGYWILTRLHLTRHRTVREHGYHILFKATGVGAAVFAIAHLIILLIYCAFPEAKEVWRSNFPYDFSETVALGSLFSYLIPFVGNLIWGAGKSADIAAERTGDRIELLIRESIKRGELVEITLKSRKSYIGRTLASAAAASDTPPDIAMIPVASGYRDRETQTLIPEINYALVMEKSLLDYTDFRIVFPRSQVVSVRLFDLVTYQQFYEEQTR